MFIPSEMYIFIDWLEERKMILNVNPQKKKQLLSEVKKLNQKSSWLYYFNMLSLPVLILISVIIILIMQLSGDPAPIIDTIVFFSTMCLLIKLVLSLLNMKFATIGISELTEESLIIDDNSITFSRHSLVSTEGDSILLSTINFKDIHKCEYDAERKKITIFADYTTVDFVGNQPVNSAKGTQLSLYDYYEQSVYNILKSKNINMEVKTNG